MNEKVEEEEDDGTKEGTLIPGDRNKTRHLPADHWGEKAASAKLRCPGGAVTLNIGSSSNISKLKICSFFVFFDPEYGSILSFSKNSTQVFYSF